MFCPSCGNEVGTATVCARCGALAGNGPAVSMAAAPGLSDNAAGALAYVTIIPAIIFLVMAEYNRRPFIRFHSFQSIFLGVACIIVTTVLTFIPVIGWILDPLVMIAFFVFWLIAIIKASGGKEYEIPFIGAFARKQAQGQ
ncbi:MAG: DUF4870 domain-containing protein [Acidobacteriaceae bacterium]|nr:DUF4870 domain-containing protein [Acidobacteriaceae bacterium]MBV9501150.1 DUF4870 domain-containing protein [Acidobacteriaceae bacterium]